MEIAKYYTDAFFEDCRKLNIKRPDVVEPATNCIQEYIRLIERLIERGYAYEAGGNIYFDTSKLNKYYIFNEHKEEDLAVGVREGVEADDNKRNKADFVLWFTTVSYTHLTCSERFVRASNIVSTTPSTSSRGFRCARTSFTVFMRLSLIHI